MTPFFQNKTNRVWFLLAAGFILFNIWNVIYNIPMVPDQHWAQKIFYVHVPSAWVGFLSYFIVMIAGIMFFVKGHDKWDDVGLAAAEIGTLFMALVLITGPIWATPIWGQPWIWEPRLTTTLILFLIYIGYFMMRSFGGHAERVRRYAAALGIIAFVDVPIIFVSVQFWAPEIQSHPQVEMASQPPGILIPFLLSLGIFTIIYTLMLKFRIHVIKIKNRNVADV
ncbi:MAG: cytochrome c biogenesis protein CcsA [Candidatus Marinimicrobia bacterium]|jgi:heme exporter protein C|nr:cytochrome c biogenesis protein CcsA [Candidatus Neomarinimicrobiota bacterium]MDP6610862.1 cytochrome c biogenesis protein CcsA [Candidatus Neomarinimicrobiota bacterium]|tara:strand:+ start:21036 stop:21707 length:672 start_codon:yes stop_codon:yes gene_type:complete